MLREVLLVFVIVTTSSWKGSCRASNRYYIIKPSNSADTVCQKEICLTLDQLAHSVLTSAGRVNLTLTFLPGVHELTKSFVTHGFEHIQIYGMKDSVIRFNGISSIQISQSSEINISNLYFTQHRSNNSATASWNGLYIDKIQSVHFDNCQFSGIHNQLERMPHLSALKITNARSIVLKRFSAESNHGKVVHINSSCHVTVLDSLFTRNVADVVHINSAQNVLIKNSSFFDNNGTLVWISSINTTITHCNITNNVNLYSGIVVITKVTGSVCNLSDSLSSYNAVVGDTAVELNNKTVNSSCLPQSNSTNCQTIYMGLGDISISYSECKKMSTRNQLSNTTYVCAEFDLPNSVVRNVSDTNAISNTFNRSNSNQYGKGTDYTEYHNTKFEVSDFRNILITSCLFTNNTSHSHRGALYIEHYSITQAVRVVISSSNFTNNAVEYLMEGGAISIASNFINGQIISCIFSDNNGSAISIFPRTHESINENILISHCVFTSLSLGGAIAIFSHSDESISGNILIHFCIFTNNTSKYNGGALFFYPHAQESISENVLIVSCTFINNTAIEGKGGAIDIQLNSKQHIRDTVHISSCTFLNNTGRYGGAVALSSSLSETINGMTQITSCVFANNTSYYYGGAIFIQPSSQESNSSVHKVINISDCVFTNNTSLFTGGGVICIFFGESINVSVIINSSLFTRNSCLFGEAILILHSMSTNSLIESVQVISSDFTDNLVTSQDLTRSNGGVISFGYPSREIFSQKLIKGAILISSCTFARNVGGAITSYESYETTIIENCTFANNTHKQGGLVEVKMNVQTLTPLNFRIMESKFVMNSAMGIVLLKAGNTTIQSSNFTGNKRSVFHLEQSTVIFLRGNHFSDNSGSVYAFNSKVEFLGSTVFSDNYHSSPIHAIQSHVSIKSLEGIVITNNTADFGGGIFLSESTLTVNHPIEISWNTADYGGAIYAHLSSIEFTSEESNQIMIANNQANQSGGGVCLVASTISILRSFVTIHANNAMAKGGGIYLEQNSRVNLLKLDRECMEWIDQGHTLQVKDIRATLAINDNRAQYGGGIYVEDMTAGGSLCSASHSKTTPSASWECFLQTVSLGPLSDCNRSLLSNYARINLQNIFITNNSASLSGDGIYGGLLDRCAISPQAEMKDFATNGLEYISAIVEFANNFLVIPVERIDILCDRMNNVKSQRTTSYISQDCFYNNFLYSSVSSEPVRMILCRNQAVFEMRKGESFRVLVMAVDQVGNPINATIHSSVITESGLSRLKEGQAEQRVGSQCTELEYNVFSQDSSAQLELYAKGPCANLGISKQVINISFLPCMCPAGLEPSSSEINCECVCDPKLQHYKISTCYDIPGTIELEEGIQFWIGIDDFTNETGYIIHDCPFDYCVDKPVNISLNSLQEIDRQCAFNRSGILCGECQPGLSLVLATSKCKECSDMYLLLLIPFALAGILLVGFILVFNVTLATGTIHGLIFYANILAANKSIFLPFTNLNFLTVFISWVNLDLGIETCFYNKMSSQAKVLFQLVFPAYLFTLIFLIIVLSKYFGFFSNLLSRKNPVATLSTLIVLSYSKLMRFIIAALQFTVLEYPDGTRERVWLYDANVHYFSPSHIPQFIAAAIILTAGGMFTILLFFSQWFSRCSNWKLMKWTRNTRYTGFMDTLHAPFTPKHRYWVGLLLFGLIIHNMVAAMAADTFLPILSAGSLSIILMALKLFCKTVYKKWTTDSLETVFLLNTAIFATSMLHLWSNKKGKQTIAFISVAIAFILFVAIVCFHFYKYLLAKTRCWSLVTMLIKNLKIDIAGLRLRQTVSRRVMYQLGPDGQISEDNDLLEKVDYNIDHPGIVDPPYTGGGEEASTNLCHTSPSIVLATRPNCLRGPASDDQAPQHH